MSKENNLKDFLADLYVGISSRKPGASKNPQDFRKEIESIPAGGSSEGGSAECLGNHIIEVDELPTENIDEAASYWDGESYYKLAKELQDIIVVENGSPISLVDTYANFGFIFELYYTMTRPTENIVISGEIMACYYVEDENDVLIYGDFSETGTNEWESIAVLMGVANGGAIADIGEATVEGNAYALVLDGLKEYLAPNGAEHISKNGSYDVSSKKLAVVDVPTPSGSIIISNNETRDVTNFASAIVKVPTNYIAGDVSELPADAPQGSFAIVLGG